MAIGIRVGGLCGMLPQHRGLQVRSLEGDERLIGRLWKKFPMMLESRRR
jgi:hypothetical protein